MNRIVVERADGENITYILKAVPQVDKNTGRLTITDGKVVIVYDTSRWTSFLVDPLTEDQMSQIAAAQQKAKEATVE